MRHDVCTKLIWIIYVIHNLAVGSRVTEETMITDLADIIGVRLMSSGSNRSGKAANSVGCSELYGLECHIIGSRAIILFLIYIITKVIIIPLGTNFLAFAIFALVYNPVAFFRCQPIIVLNLPRQPHFSVVKKLHIHFSRTNVSTDGVVE